MAKISVKNLTKKYEDVVAIDELSVEIGDGEFVVILGPSGCGKTTLLRCIAGLETPEGGHVLIDGRVVDDLPPRDRDLAMVFQNYALFPQMTVYKNIAFPLTVRGKPRGNIESKVREIARFLGIESLLEKKPGQLSGGEQQRVAIARAIVRQPGAFLMDEPLSNLDAPLRASMRAELKRIQKTLGITSIYVTHDQLEALALATKMAVMSKGRLLQFDRPENVYSKPAHAFVAGFVGSPPANLVDVLLVEDGGDFYLESTGFRYPLTKGDEQFIAKSGDLVLAIRAEDIRVSTSRMSPSSYEGKIDSAESMGRFTLLSLTLGDLTLKSVVPADFKVNLEQQVWFELDSTKLHIYDKQSGLLLR